MKTHTITTYSFNELSEEAQARALENHRFTAVDGVDWWDSLYQMLEEFGIKVKSFDIDRASYVKFDWDIVDFFHGTDDFFAPLQAKIGEYFNEHDIKHILQGELAETEEKTKCESDFDWN